jgi:hypothetical protein
MLRRTSSSLPALQALDCRTGNDLVPLSSHVLACEIDCLLRVTVVELTDTVDRILVRVSAARGLTRRGIGTHRCRYLAIFT